MAYPATEAAGREITLTSWLDPFLRGIAETTGIPTPELSETFGCETYGAITGTVVRTFTKGLLSKLILLVAGVATGGAGLLMKDFMGKPVPLRLREELLRIGTHLCTYITDPSPSEIEELAESIRGTIEAIKTGDINKFLEANIRDFNNIKKAFRDLIDSIIPIFEGDPITTPTPEVEYYESPSGPTSGEGNNVVLQSEAEITVGESSNESQRGMEFTPQFEMGGETKTPDVLVSAPTIF